MAVCSVCSNELRPEWKFCVYCGLRVAPLLGEPAAPDDAIVTTIDRSAHVNPVAVVAVVFGALLSPLAAIFGHVALSQIRRSGERGRMPALVGTALGYGWAVMAVGLVIALVVTNRS